PEIVFDLPMLADCANITCNCCNCASEKVVFWLPFTTVRITGVVAAGVVETTTGGVVVATAAVVVVIVVGVVVVDMAIVVVVAMLVIVVVVAALPEVTVIETTILAHSEP